MMLAYSGDLCLCPGTVDADDDVDAVAAVEGIDVVPIIID